MLWGRAGMRSKRSVRLLARIAAAFFLVVGGAGCAAHTQHMQVAIAADANNNSPVIFSVILPRNQAVFKKSFSI